MPAETEAAPAPRAGTSLLQHIGPIKALTGVAAITGALLPAAIMTDMLHAPAARRFPPLWHRAVAHCLGMKTRVSGTPVSGSVLYVSNHMSWLDIVVLGSRLGGSFVAKSEVAGMPVVNYLASLQQTLYVERARRANALQQTNTIRERLRAGGNVILFPEGTSTDGVRVLPFKSTLFSALDGDGTDDFRVQPISLAYTHLNNLPLTRQRMLDIAWIGDMDFGPHVLDCMRLGRIGATIHCHPPVRRGDFTDRKMLARYCHSTVAEGYRRLVRGGI